MKFAEPTKPHRKSGIWGTRGLVEGIEFNVQSCCEEIALKTFVGLRPVVFGPGIRISCHGAPPTSACAAFIKESRMKLANAILLDRKSGVRFGEPGAPVPFPRDRFVPQTPCATT
jgi:hypothetical protein